MKFTTFDADQAFTSISTLREAPQNLAEISFTIFVYLCFPDNFTFQYHLEKQKGIIFLEKV